jgi:hypothetical protein
MAATTDGVSCHRRISPAVCKGDHGEALYSRGPTVGAAAGAAPGSATLAGLHQDPERDGGQRRGEL